MIPMRNMWASCSWRCSWTALPYSGIFFIFFFTFSQQRYQRLECLFNLTELYMPAFYSKKESLWRDSLALWQHVWVYVDKYQLYPGWEISSYPQINSFPREPPHISFFPSLPLLLASSIASLSALSGVSRRCLHLITAPVTPSCSPISLFPSVFILSYLLIISPLFFHSLHLLSLFILTPLSPAPAFFFFLSLLHTHTHAHTSCSWPYLISGLRH